MEISISRIIGHAILATIAWVIFSFTSHRVIKERPPRANIIAGIHTMMDGRKTMILAPSPEELRHADTRLPFMTREEFDSESKSFQRRRMLMGLLAIGSAFATFWFGSTMGDSWLYGVATVCFGPLAVSYFMYRRAWSPW